MVKNNFLKDFPWWLIIIATAIFLLIILNNSSTSDLVSSDEEVGLSDWQTTYEELARESNVYNTGSVEGIRGEPNIDLNTMNTEYYDYNDRVISRAAERIALESTSSLDAITKTLDYVYEEIDYVYGESDVNCFTGTAPQILTSGSGQCDTQSIVTIAILRKMGIAAKPVGGCVYTKPNKLLQSMLLNSFTPQKSPEINPIVLDGETFSRGGGLHAWVVAWVPGTGWVGLEPTSGQLVNNDLYVYHVELFPEDVDKESICISNNFDYANACINQDLLSLNANGEGLLTEVVVE